MDKLLTKWKICDRILALEQNNKKLMKNKFNHKLILFICFVGALAIVPCFAALANCNNECSYTGQVELADGSTTRKLERICGNYDIDDCIEWSAWKYGNTGAACGDGTCNTSAGENTYNCPGDCGHPMEYDCFNCGDGRCDSTCGENSYTCSNDCTGLNVTSTLSISQTGRNVSRGESTWAEIANAYPGESMQFKITVTNTGNTVMKNVVVKDTLSTSFNYSGGLTVDGITKTDSVISGINIGEVLIGQTRTIIFDARIASAELFGYGRTRLTNYATVSSDNCSQLNDTAEVDVEKAQVLAAVTELSTGVEDWFFMIYPSVVIAAIFTTIIMFGEYLARKNRALRKILDRMKILRLYMLSK